MGKLVLFDGNSRWYEVEWYKAEYLPTLYTYIVLHLLACCPALKFTEVPCEVRKGIEVHFF